MKPGLPPYKLPYLFRCLTPVARLARRSPGLPLDCNLDLAGFGRFFLGESYSQDTVAVIG
jgi:hypothetical protein